MILTGFTDEAGPDLATQIKASKELGWNYLSARMVDGVNFHDLPESDFEKVCDQLDANNIKVAEFGSLIGSWSKNISSDFDLTLAEIKRAIPRMQRLGTQIVRVMSYAQEPWGQDQFEQERFRRLREIVSRFHDAGLTVAHENCMNYGGFSSDHTLRLIEEVPNLKLIFDTGNPLFQRDRSKPEPEPWQDSWEFYQATKEHTVHIHIKDCISPENTGEEPEYVFPGEGQGYVKEILSDLKASDYKGFIAIEPHVATVFHDKDSNKSNHDECYNAYIKYGKMLESLVQQA